MHLRKIKIGRATVGLIGLEQAMQQAVSRKMSADEATAFLFNAVSRENYIPSTATDLYRHALRREYLAAENGGSQSLQQLTIKILGPGCVSCNKLNTMIFDIMQRLDIAADIEQIHDLDEIWRHGVITTPALIINGSIKCSGRMPPPEEVEQWLVEAAERL
ncbi:MAG: thioredoxin family protein [Proteobacteria bacterium]|nr:thioredoxin family protein [Pseudomonadota bacterium]MBU4296908.1 thioredoxin family protein [Pseudomonadota bacterium]MCG2749286.1 thioredoxin family protein [Desulfobulbaceae bacterium]